MTNIVQTIEQKRAAMPAGAEKVLDRRTLQRGHDGLLSILKNGMSVLDVGCGTGSITEGIAHAVGSTGKVLGIDMSVELIAKAKEKHNTPSQLSYEVQDIFSLKTDARFDVITTARTLQWIANPLEALRKMKSLLKPNGCISVLDYNHTKIEWHPEPPPSMKHVYDRFLKWRSDAGMNNAIADTLNTLFSNLQLDAIHTANKSEFTDRTQADFREAAGIWLQVAETRGKQLVRDNYITEAERLLAIAEYAQWIENDFESMKLYLLHVHAYSNN